MNETLFNLSNFTVNIFRYAFDPYLALFGNLTWGFIFGTIGAALYANNRSLATIFGYLVIVGVIFALVLPYAIYAIFALITGLVGTSIVYFTIVESK